MMSELTETINDTLFDNEIWHVLEWESNISLQGRYTNQCMRAYYKLHFFVVALFDNSSPNISNIQVIGK